MSTKVTCPSCRASLRVIEAKLHRLLRCPSCSKTFRLRPAAAQTAPRPAAARTGGRRPPRLPDDDVNRTLMGSVPAPGTMPPPLEDDDEAPPPRRRKSGGLGWVLVVGLLALLLAGGVGGYFVWATYFNAPDTSTNPGPSAHQDTGKSGATANVVFGKCGALDIGSKGIKVLVVDVFPDDKGGYDFNVVWEDKANDTLVAAGADGLTFDPKVLDAVVDHIKQFCTAMRDKHGVPAERIVVLCSSGVWVPFANNPGARAKNQAALAERVKAATGLDVVFNSVADEARLGMSACVPNKDMEEALFVDIGSGNTKGGYFEGKDVFQAMGVELGSVTYTDKVSAEAKRSGKPFADQVAELRPSLLEEPLRKQARDRPGLAAQKKVHLVGGAVWALATFTHPNDNNLRVELTAADIDRYAVLVRKPKDAVRNEVLAQVKDPEQWKKMDKEVAGVQKVFNPENLQAGAEILQALSNTYDFKDKQLYFFRKGNIAWPLGYVLEKNVKK
jgi:predicted Zn finger-like uncharacterized protein